jgi:hypothetical protein
MPIDPPRNARGDTGGGTLHAVCSAIAVGAFRQGEGITLHHRDRHGPSHAAEPIGDLEPVQAWALVPGTTALDPRARARVVLGDGSARANRGGVILMDGSYAHAMR